MIFIIMFRLAVLFGICWVIWKVISFFLEKASTQKSCPGCDGKGYWLSLRERERCKQCDGTGLIDK